MSITENKEGSRTYTWCVATKISINLNNFRIDGRFCDIDIISGETKMKAHRVVLAASCEYFDAMFNVGLEESQKGRVVLPSVPPGILPMIIDFIYTGEIIIDKGTVQQLLIGADMLQLRELVVGCGEFLKRELHPSNALGIFRIAETYNCTELAEKGLAYLRANWNVVANGEELLDLPLQQLITLISSEELKVNEAQVLYPALKWLEHDPVNRRSHCFEVLRHVRLPLISPQILDDALKTVQDPSIAAALKILRVDMKQDKGAVVAAEPRGARRLLILTGGGSAPISSMLKFDLHKREWEELAPMGIRRIKAGVAILDGRVYVVGGELAGQFLKDSKEPANGEVYEPQLDKWSNIKQMNESRSLFGLTGFNGKLVAFGGLNGTYCRNSIEVYNPVSDVWIDAGRMPQPRYGMGVVTYGGRIYIVGGGKARSQHTRDLLCYQPGARQWSALTSMRHPRCNTAAVVLGEHLYVIGGYEYASAERYSFEEDRWEAVEAPQMRDGCAAGAVEGVLVVVGGDINSNCRNTVDCVDVYDPASGTWSRVLRRDLDL